MSFLFQKSKEQFNNKLPFVCYCKPNSDKIIAFLQKNDALFELENDYKQLELEYSKWQQIIGKIEK